MRASWSTVLMLAAAAIAASTLYAAPAMASGLKPSASPMSCVNAICDWNPFYEYFCGSGKGCGCVSGGDQETCNTPPN
jgi:hypothetical protein